ncbi:MAG: radical SAM protein [Desulfobacterales bacterium]|nr:radical SAM protein [Desulfobacterales bacterium]
MKKRKKPPLNTINKHVTALAANSDGKIFELEGYAAVGMAGASLVPLEMVNTIKMPYGSELMFLPDRMPILFNMDTGQLEILAENPYMPGESIYPVSAFNSPGYVNSYTCAYMEPEKADPLPLFSYGAVGWCNNEFRSSVMCVDRERRQDLRLMKPAKIIEGIKKFRKTMPSNRLREHLEKCAMEYGCPAAKNFFIGRYEAPLPTSRYCNAKCLGCISLQKNNTISCCQERISFTPSSDEIVEVALAHIGRVRKSIVSFGQGCEGDPLLAADVIEPAIATIRATTTRGTINMNTNASRPDILAGLFEAGLDSLRVSINSVREKCYNAYFRPKGYTLSDVAQSIDIANTMGKFVSINYLNCPGFTDTQEEVNTLISFMHDHPIHFIQWRNLNYDPLRYFNTMNANEKQGEPIGIGNVLRLIKKRFPHIKYGYFNPPKESF